ncbi:DNRLRE domain-containing protein [Streptococcus suis]|uniref:Cell wall-associated polypeptide CWBP200 n=15 Tax=Streptococcus suis TaxID=1307 RepID=A0A0Z8GK47_STRSU|nr:DNRLRE domain-containing protein [Streptococcus suis]NQP01019.1 DNRLRE domain-containing protein [Streptococcus suis]NQP44843.1 DNRLRE domain-containing protein [Streptococcus suis]CYV00248.1 Cell wall-associated polypeptide CWBP200 [Streptococcus suis]CYV11915.1 Cell wall-associated polypeptide CWBP200 [Streptococcus suis]
MKRLHKLMNWLLLVTLLISNSPIMYAQEISQAIEQSQTEQSYQEAVTEATSQTVGSENANTEKPSSEQTEPSTKKEEGDAIQQPKVTDGTNPEEAALKAQYGEPVAVSGQEQLFRVDDTHFVTYIGSDVKTYIDQDGVEVPVDLSLYSYHANGQHYYLPKESPVGVVLPSEVKEETPIDVIYKDEKISLYPLEKTYDQATVEQNAVLYNNVDGKTDIQYTVQSNGVKEEIVLAEWGGKNSFTYGLDASAYDVSLEDNQILVREKGKSTILFVLTAPMMVDNAGESSSALTLDLKQTEKGYEVIVIASEDWLSSKERQYPVRIDPTITVPREKILDVVTSTVHGQYQGYAYGYVGYMTNLMIGVPEAKDIGRSRMYFKINYDFKKSIPSEARIDSATFNLYQYTAPGSMATQFGAYRLKQDFDINNLNWNNSVGLEMEIAGANAISAKKIGMHNFDIRETVNSWVQGLEPNYGLVIAATDEGADGGAFYTTEATADNAGQIGFTPDKAPSLTINWSVPDPVDVNYPIGNTTINLRTMVKTDKKGQLQFQGVFADGLTTPGAQVDYNLSDASKNYQGQNTASFSYKYPDSSPFDSVFEKGTTKYKDKLSNWQTQVPFTEPELNKVYTIDAESKKDGQTSGKKSSDTFLIYKVTQYDTLPKIANYYGVPLKQIAFDNRIQDMLVVKNNTLFIRNPRKNATKPYNPPTLTDDVKKDVDMLLMGRGLHCEFDFEPININTGNFYLDRTDVTIRDVNDEFEITRFYNSKAAGINSLFGRGWSFAFNEQLSSDEDQNLYYTRTDGSILKFTKDGDKYEAPAGYDLQLEVKTLETKQGDFGGEDKEDYEVKEYRITDTDNQEKVFNFHGLLTSQTDEKGNKTAFDYNENFQLTKITSPTGLVFTLTYNDAGYIGAIQVPNGSTLSYEYDENGNLITYTDATGVPTRYEYDDKGLMTAWYDGNGTKIIENEYDDQNRVVKQTDGTGAVSTLAYSDGQTVTTDANGNQTTYTYDDQYRTTGITYPDGTSISKTYDGDNRLASETNELGQTTSYTYDSNGNVLSETRFDGAVKTSTYDDKNHLLSVTDFGGEATKKRYDDKGNLLQTTLPDGSSISYEVDGQGRIVSTTDAAGNTTSFAYEGANLVKITNPLGGVSTLTYNAHNQVTGITNPRGGTTTITYDAEGRKLSEKDADGVGTTHTFDQAGQVIGVTEGNGNTTTFTYDAFGRKIGASNGEGGNYSYTYDGVGNQLSLTDAEGHTTTYTYDSRGRLLTETDALGQIITYQRDGIGRVVTRTNEAGNSSSFTYDDRHQAIKTITDALGQVTENTYDVSGHLTDVTYPIGTKTQTTYDVMGRVLSYIDEAGQTVSYTYDSVGNKLTETKDDQTTSYSYDVAGNVTGITYPDGTTVTYKLDAMGNILSMTDALGQETTYEYSPAGRLVATVNALGHRTSYTYDGNGNQNSVTDAAGYTASSTFTGQNQVASVTDGLGNQTTFAYNQMEQLLEEVDALGGKTSYTYDALGHPIAVVDANGHTTKMSYTPTAQLKEVVLPDGSSVTQEYDALDRLVKQTHSSGLITEYTYDAADRLLTKKDNQDLNEVYTYDKVGNRLTLTNSLGEVTKYSYDSDNQLTKVEYADGTSETFTYDVMGNVATSTDQEGKTKTYHYDANGNLTKTVDHLKRETSYSYDALDRVVTEKDPDGNTMTYEYDVLGNLSKVKDANGHESQYGYDANQQLVLYTDPKGQTTAFKYDPLGRVVETLSPTGAKQTFTYDGLGNRLTETTGEGNTTTFTYDSLSRLASMKRPTGGETTYTYDATGSLIKETDANGHSTSYVNDLYGRVTKRTLPNQAEYTYSYDALGRLSKQTGPQGLAKSYTYDVAGNLTKETDQSDRSNSYTYDKVGRLLTAKNALDLETTYSYDEAGNLAKLTRPSGATTSFDYTTLDQLKTVTTPTGREITSTYDPVGQATKRVVNGKRETSYTYDPNGNLLEETNPLGQVTKRTYDALNRLVSESDTAGQLTMYTYDHDNRVTKVMDDAGATASLAYDANGNVTSVFSGSQRVTSYTYDLEDQLLTATQGTGDKASTSTYTYDGVGNVTSITNGNGKVTTYKYDQLSNVVERMTAMGDKETYTYNIDNQLEKVTKADGKTITYDYNKLDQLLKVDYSEKQDGQVLYTYDADGRRVSMSDLTGTTNYETNAEGAITGVRQGDGSLIQYDYDDYGNISKMTYPDGRTVSYTYDELDRLTSVTDVKGKKTTYTYNEAGDMTEVKRADGTRSFLTYDKAHRVTELRHVDKKDKLISSYTYEYDDGNYITKESINQDGKTVVHAYSYDTLGQVETMTVSDKAGKELSKLSYTYDLAGNKLTSTESIDGKEEKTTFSYDDNNRLTKLENKDGITTYTYDKNGNRTASKKNDEKLDYIYDTENRLLAVKDKEGLLMAALYDGDDNRVFMASRKEGKNTYQLFSRKPKDKGKSGRKSPYTAPNGEENSLFWYGFSQNILQSLSALPQTIGSIWHEIFDDISTAYHQKVAKDRATKEGLVVNPPDLDNLPGEGEVTYASQVQDVLIPYTTREDTYHYYEERNYVNDINREYTEVLQTYDHDLKARETYTYGNGRASYLDNQEDTNYNYLTNQSGSVTGLTQDGEVVASSTYHLYGSTKETTDTTGNPYAYNGEARDVTGLDYLRARYYDSQAGTFLTEDSYPGELTTPLTQNGYAYVSNNPVNYTDPSGHFFKKLLKGAGKLLTKAKNAVVNFAKNTARAVVNVAKKAYNIGRNIVNTVVNTAKGVVNWAGTQINNAKNWAVNQWNNFQRTPVYQGAQQVYQSANHYAQQQQAQARAQAEQRRQQHIRDEYSQSTGIKTTPKTREAKSLFRNWGKALKEMYTHVCKTAKRVKKQVANYVKKIDWKKVVKTSAYIAGEFFSVNDIYRVITGKDPLTGEKASRLEAAAWLTADLLTMGGSKAAKVAKVASKANKVADTVKASKAVSKVNKAIDAGKTFVKSGINKVLDTPIGFSRQVAMAGGPAMDIGGPTLREAGQYVQKGWDNMVQAFAKNGDEVVEGTSKGSKGAPPPNLSPEGAGRKGAFNEAKRKNGIPTSQNPDRVGPNLDKRGNRQPGRSYEFDRIQDGETVTVTIRDDAGGHVYKDDPSQNRGPHFNDDGGNHYDY